MFLHLPMVLGLLMAGDGAPEEAAPPELCVQLGLSEIFEGTRLGTIAIEYRHSPLWRELRPMVGVAFTNDEDKLLYLGMQYDFHLTERWRLSPNTAAGYFNDGGGLHLGGHIEFRSGIELTYRFHERWRLGLHLSHSSNAGLFDSNPGTETLSLSLASRF